MCQLNTVIEKYKRRLERFKSPLADDWEVVLFGAIDTLHGISIEGGLNTRDLVLILNSMIANGEIAVKELEQSISEVTKLKEGINNNFLRDRIDEVIEMLTAVKTYEEEREWK